MPSVVHPPNTSMMCARHFMEGSLSLRLCRNEWITHPVGTGGFNHLFNAALAEFKLRLVSLQYLGKQNVNGMTQFSWKSKAKNLPTGFAAD